VSVLFIGTRYSNLYTAVDTPAEAAWFSRWLLRHLAGLGLVLRPGAGTKVERGDNKAVNKVLNAANAAVRKIRRHGRDADGHGMSREGQKRPNHRRQILLGTAAATAAKAAAGGLWQSGGRAGPGTLSLDVPHHTPAGHRSAILLLSASRDEEVVGRSQVRQPGGEFNCPRVGDQRQDRERIKAFLHRDLRCGEGSRPRGAPSYEYKKRVEARDVLVKAFLEQYDIGKAPTGDSGSDIKSRMKLQAHEWWNSSEQAVSLRKDNEWGADCTVALSGRRKPCLPAGGCAAPEHDEQTPKVCADVDEETVKYSVEGCLLPT
jgi:hypothetical protein